MATKTDILQLTFKEDISLGFEFIPINDHYAQNMANLRRPHRAAFYLILWFKNGTPVHTVDFHPISPFNDSFVFVRKDAVQFLISKILLKPARCYLLMPSFAKRSRITVFCKAARYLMILPVRARLL